jgi:hypothetical protein
MCYYTKIKEMMQQSKGSGEKPAIVKLDDNCTIYVRYFEQFDEYTFQYSWPINGGEDEIKKEVCKVLSGYINSPMDLEIVQVGFVNEYHTNAEYFCKVIGVCKDKVLLSQRDTTYIFGGTKVYRVAKYSGIYESPFLHVNYLQDWNQLNLRDKVKNLEMEVISAGLSFKHLKEQNKFIFSLGEEGSNIVFETEAIEDLPPIILTDSIIETKTYK